MTSMVIETPARPNGIGLYPEGKHFYISDTVTETVFIVVTTTGLGVNVLNHRY